MIAATKYNSAEPDYMSIAKRIRKAWKKPMKIFKFYKNLLDRSINTKNLVALKSCITMQYYFLYGPKDVLHPYKNIEATGVLLEEMHKKWSKTNINTNLNKQVNIFNSL